MKYEIKKGMISVKEIPFKKGEVYKVEEFTEGLNGELNSIIYEIQITGILKSGKVKFDNLTYGYKGVKMIPEPSNKTKVYTLKAA